MQIDKPAVVFSEQGWKMFLNFMKDIVGESDDTDVIVDQFFKRQGTTTSQSSVNDLDAIADLIERDLKQRTEPVDNLHLVNLLNEAGHEISNRGVTGIMRAVMKRKHNIIKQTPGHYMWLDGGDNGLE